MSLRHLTLYAAVATLWAVALPVASAGERMAECEGVTRQYDRVALDLGSAVQRYANCVSGSRGRNACSVEFSQVRAAQGSFEDAVARLRRTCASPRGHGFAG